MFVASVEYCEDVRFHKGGKPWIPHGGLWTGVFSVISLLKSLILREEAVAHSNFAFSSNDLVLLSER